MKIEIIVQNEKRDKWFGMNNERRTVEYKIEVIINNKKYTGWAEIMIHSDRIYLGELKNESDEFIKVTYETKCLIESCLPSALLDLEKTLETI